MSINDTALLSDNMGLLKLATFKSDSSNNSMKVPLKKMKLRNEVAYGKNDDLIDYKSLKLSIIQSEVDGENDFIPNKAFMTIQQ